MLQPQIVAPQAARNALAKQALLAWCYKEYAIVVYWMENLGMTAGGETSLLSKVAMPCAMNKLMLLMCDQSANGKIALVQVQNCGHRRLLRLDGKGRI